jgi:peptide/nickel transport system permease protein
MPEQLSSPVATRPVDMSPDTLIAVPDTAPEYELARTKRVGVGGWLAATWLIITVLGVVILPFVLHNPSSASLLADKGIFKVAGHPLGGDGNGNDMLLELALGGRNSLIVALGAVSFGLIIGGSLGLFAGYFRGRTDTLLTGAFNVLLAIPQFVLAVALVSVLAANGVNSQGAPAPASFTRRLVVLVVALGIVSIPILARITRANALQWSQREFVLAARAQGASNLRIMMREVLPNVMPAMFSIALLGIAVAMVAEGGLSILGAGVQGGYSWGNIIATGRGQFQNSPHVVFEPVTCIFLTVLSINYLGDIVRARFDVRESTL